MLMIDLKGLKTDNFIQFMDNNIKKYFIYYKIFYRNKWLMTKI